MRGDLFEFRSNPNRAIQSVYEDIPGGATLCKSDLKNGATGFMSEGILISLDSDGLGYLTKTAKAWTSFTAGASGIHIYKNNEFLPGDNISNTAFTTISRNIISIDRSNVSYDFLNIGSGFGASGGAGTILVETQASGVSGTDASLKYTPHGIGISEFPVNLAFENSGFGLMVRGTVREANMPYPIDENLKDLLPLIRFV